ncbi:MULTISPECIES: serine--tRNA ligase [unclassified Xanthobacter]|uniref:serine--tRNA ligase n=1 Tax=unclassified Xanthobacter TaxID=2623496 RepID=UPI001EDE71B3|nr:MULTISPECIES: serine--tRNA ligase [unclassified Xanthobacter]
MHDIKWIREQPEGLVTALSRRGGNAPEAQLAADILVKKLIGLDEQRRASLTRLEGLLARRNAASKEIGQAKAQKDEAKAQALMAEVARIKEDVPALEAEVKAVEQALNDELAAIPNVPLADVPDGKDEHENVERSRFGAPRSYAFTPKQHFEIGEGLGQMDFETAAKLSGARFVVNKGPMARLERALGQLFLDTHTGEHGYMEVNPPVLVRDETMYGTAQLPKFADDQFFTFRAAEFEAAVTEAQVNASREVSALIAGGADVAAALDQVSLAAHIKSLELTNRLWLVPTAEVPLTNLVREAILSEDELPLRLTALTNCFRAEAGAAGRDTRGMIRQHQFNKVELVSITAPEKSAEEHERMLACAEAVLKKLDLHYRVVTLCTGDMGFASQKTYDIEVWLPGQAAFREISSCSVCGDFQARRMNARFRPADAKDGKGAPRFLHTLNGSGVAVGRALVAVLETYQQENGAVAVPDALAPYMGGLKVIEKLS